MYLYLFFFSFVYLVIFSFFQHCILDWGSLENQSLAVGSPSIKNFKRKWNEMVTVYGCNPGPKPMGGWGGGQSALSMDLSLCSQFTEIFPESVGNFVFFAPPPPPRSDMAGLGPVATCYIQTQSDRGIVWNWYHTPWIMTAKHLHIFYLYPIIRFFDASLELFCK